MTATEVDLGAARRAAAACVSAPALAAPGAPGLLIGSGPSLIQSLPSIETPVREHWCVMDAVPAARIWLRSHRLAPTSLGLLPDLPPTVAVYLALRAIGCDPIVLCGVDGCFTDGLVCGAADDQQESWACELGPFRTIEDLHGAAILAAKRDGTLCTTVERTGAAVVSCRALLTDHALLERCILDDAARGLRTLDLDRRGLAKRGAEQSTAAEALPRRGAVAWPRIASDLSAGAAETGAQPSAAAAHGAAGLASDLATSLATNLAVNLPAQRVRSGPLTMEVRSPVRVAAVVPVDPSRGGTGVPRHLDSEFGSGTVLAATLARLGLVRGIERIVLLVPEGFDPRPLFDPSRVALPIEIESCGAAVFPPEQDAIRTARLWADTAWRGGIGGACVWDEIVAPAAMAAALASRGLDGALCCAPDWPLVMVEESGGCDELVERFRQARGERLFVAAPGPPGLGACVIEQQLLATLARREPSGPVLVGDLWRGHPFAETFAGCVSPVERIRRCMVRGVFDSMRAKLRMRRAIEPIAIEHSPAIGLAGLGGWTVSEALEHQFLHLPPAFVPQHLMIELNTGRRASGSASPHRLGSIQRAPMSERLLERILEEVEAPRDVVVTFGHAGDPLWHPNLPQFVRMARAAGVRAVHVRTELVADTARIDALLEAAPDVISVDLQAHSPGTYRALMGINRFERAVENLERVLACKGGADPRLTKPLIAVRIQRRDESAMELAAFVDHWERRAGTAIVEGIPVHAENPESRPDPLVPCEPPLASVRREGSRRMVILSDGRVPLSELDLLGERTIGSVARSGVLELWRDLWARRRQMIRGAGDMDPDLRWWQP